MTDKQSHRHTDLERKNTIWMLHDFRSMEWFQPMRLTSITQLSSVSALTTSKSTNAMERSVSFWFGVGLLLLDFGGGVKCCPNRNFSHGKFGSLFPKSDIILKFCNGLVSELVWSHFVEQWLFHFQTRLITLDLFCVIQNVIFMSCLNCK